MNLYWRKSPEELYWFYDLMESFPEIEFFQPAPEKAPWHVQCFLDNGELVNFWPHAVKAMAQCEPPVTVGKSNIKKLIRKVKLRERQDFEVIEDD